MQYRAVASVISRAFLFRLASAIAGAASFGLVAAPMALPAPLPFWPAAFLFAFAYGFVFLGGAGYRILSAIALRDPSADASVSWTGGATAAALATILAAGALAVAGHDAARLVAGFGVAANVSYAFAKLGCIEAGCCAAVRPLPGRFDLRLVELGATLAILALALSALAAKVPALAAAAGVGGHLVLRLGSRLARDRRPKGVMTLAGTGQELLPLLVLFGVTVGLAAT